MPACSSSAWSAKRWPRAAATASPRDAGGEAGTATGSAMVGVESRRRRSIRKAMPGTGFLHTCRACQHEFRIPSQFSGRTVPCPHCRRPMELQAGSGRVEDKLIGKLLGGCKLVRRLGAGAIGVVYEAEMPGQGRHVAVKMLTSKAANDERVVQRFQREAKLCAAIQHPNVVGVHSCRS